MCKLFCITDSKNLSKDQLKKLTDAVSKEVSKTEKDGLGLMYSQNKKIKSKKFINNKDFNFFKKTKEYNFAKKTKESFGGEYEEGVPVNSLVIHGRTSTNALGLKNTHPIISGSVVLCHNGVVQYSGPEFKKSTDNDTEYISHVLSNGGISELENYIHGYYALMYYNLKTLDLEIIRDNIASLYFVEFEQNKYMFATTESILNVALASLGINLEEVSIEFLNDNTRLIFKNELLVEVLKISPSKVKSEYALGLSSKSLGYNLTDLETYDYGARSIDPYYNIEDEYIDYIYSSRPEELTILFRGNEISREQFDALKYSEQVSVKLEYYDGLIMSIDDFEILKNDIKYK